MYMFNQIALYYGASVVVGLGLLMLVLSFRDTRRGFLNLFDLRTVRRFRDAVLAARWRVSLRSVLAAILVLSLCFAYTVLHWRKVEFPAVDVLALGLYAAIVVVPLLAFFYSDAFGVSSRTRWKKYLVGSPEFESGEEESPEDANTDDR